jgi:fermentation-respiration switch protein FrsA (DUF1100 family)
MYVKKILLCVFTLLVVFAASRVLASDTENPAAADSSTVAAYDTAKIDIQFLSNGMKLKGFLFVPNKEGQLPAIAIGHPAGGVKEQTVSLYAERLASYGFVTLVFDAAYQGESEGEPRGLEDPFQRAEDIRAAVSFLASRGNVDENKIGALGICASGGYVPFAAQTDRRIKAAATISAVKVGGSSIIENDALLSQTAKARNAEARGEGISQGTYVVMTKEEAEKFPPKSLNREAYDYYRTPRGAHPRSTQKGVMRMDVAAQFNAFENNGWISPRSLLMIAGTEADTLNFSEEAISKAKEPKELFLVEGASHVDLYDKEPYVGQVVEKLEVFFSENLK